MARVNSVGAFAVALAALLALSAWPAVATAAAQNPGLQIVVLQGEDGENVIARGADVPTLVEVRDGNDQPVSGVTVRFLLGEGGTATLNAGLQEVALTTNALGQAAVMVNPVATGAVELSVTVTLAGETATVTIAQANFATDEDAAAGVLPTGIVEPEADAVTPAGGGAVVAPASGGGLGVGAIAGLAGAGAAVGVGLAVAGGGDSPPPPPPSASVPSAPPPPTLTAGDGQLAVGWSAPADNGAAIIDYDVQYRPAGGSWSELGGQLLDRRATITGLTNGTTYEVRVRAGNSVGKGNWSASATGTPASVPSRPAAPTLTAGDRQLGVSWRAPAANGATIGDYDVRYRPAGGAWSELGGQLLDRRATITGLTNGTTYEVQVAGGQLRRQGGVVCERDRHAGGGPAAPDGPDGPDVDGGRRSVGGELECAGDRRTDHRLRRAVPVDRRLDGDWRPHGDERDAHGSDERDDVRSSGAGAELGCRQPVVSERAGDADGFGVGAVEAADADGGGRRR